MIMAKKPLTGWGLFWRKTGAFIIDLGLSYAFLVWPFLTLIEKSMPAQGLGGAVAFLSEHPQTVFSLNALSLFIGFMVIAYFVVLQFVIGSTIGMLVFSLRVVPVNHNLTLWKCIGRNLFLIPFFPFIFLIFTELFTVLWSRGQGRMLERFSSTRTIYEPRYELRGIK